MKRGTMKKICSALLFTACLSAGVGFSAFTSAAAAALSTPMTCLGASTKIVSDIKDSGLAFKYSLDSELFANTAAGSVAFDSGVSAGVIVCPEELPVGFVAGNTATYGDSVKTFETAASYWRKNGTSGEMEGIVYLYNIPGIEYDTEVTSIGYVTVDGVTTYTAPTVRSMAYVAQKSLANDTLTEDQEKILNKFLSVKGYYSNSLPLEIMPTTAFTANIPETDKAAVEGAFGSYVYGVTAGQVCYGGSFALSRAYLDDAFADPETLAVEFDYYCNNKVDNYRFAYGTSGTTQIGSSISVKASGVLRGSVTREVYELFCAETEGKADPNADRDTKFPLNIRFYVAKDSASPNANENGHLTNNFICVGNFRLVTFADAYTIDFEEGASPYIHGNDHKNSIYDDYMTVCQSDVFGKTSYVLATKEGAAAELENGLRFKCFTVDRAYLDAVFANGKTEGLAFDVYANKTIQYLAYYCNNNGTSLNISTDRVTANVAKTITITRETYRALVAKGEYDLDIRMIGLKGDDGYIGSAEARVYFDNFRPVMQAEEAEPTYSFTQYAYGSVGSSSYVNQEGERVETEDFFTLERFQEYKDCGFDVIMPQTAAIASQTEKRDLCLSLAQQVGLKVLLTDNHILYASAQTDKPLVTKDGVAGTYATQAELEAKIVECMEPYANHPAFYGVILADEVSNTLLDSGNYGLMYRTIKKLYPDCYIHANLPSIGSFTYTNLTASGKYPEVSEEFMLTTTGKANIEEAVTWFRGLDASAAEKSRRKGLFLAERYRLLCEKFLNETGADGITVDAYPMYNSILEGYLVNLEVPARIAAERGVEFRIVTQTSSLNTPTSVNERLLDEDDLYWLNDMLLGFGCKNFGYYTYYTHGATVDESGNVTRWYTDGSSFLTHEGEQTQVYTTMQEIFANNEIFASTVLQFTYQTANLYNEDMYATQTHNAVDIHGEFEKLSSVSTDGGGSTLVTELYDSANGRYMYMAMNTVDPFALPSAAQTITLTFDEGYSTAQIYYRGEFTTVTLIGGSYTLEEVMPGDAFFIILG